MSKEKKIDEFGKTTFPASFDVDEPIHAMMITPCIHYTMGGLFFSLSLKHLLFIFIDFSFVIGLQITAKGEVLTQQTSQPIKGLYAAGEVTGGVHGANRLAGNSLLECTVFGRIAGTFASA